MENPHQVKYQWPKIIFRSLVLYSRAGVGLQPICINKALLEHSHDQLVQVLAMTIMTETTRLTKPELFTSWPFRNFTNSCFVQKQPGVKKLPLMTYTDYQQKTNGKVYRKRSTSMK